MTCTGYCNQGRACTCAPATTCSACNGRCPTPQACQLPIASATRPPRAAFLLADAFDRAPRFTTAIVLAVLLALWGFTGHLDDLALQSIEAVADTEEAQP